jgi:hypothetical protein
MNVGDRVKLLEEVGVYLGGCKGSVDFVGDDGYVDVTLDEDERGVILDPVVPLPPTEKDKFQVIG